MYLGEAIRQYRQDTGMSMRRFATLTGLTAAYISMLERGDNPTTGKPPKPSIDTIVSCATVMGRDPDELLAEVGNAQTAARRQRDGLADEDIGRSLAVYHSIRRKANGDIVTEPERHNILIDSQIADNPLVVRSHDIFSPYIMPDDIIILDKNIEVKGGDFVLVCGRGEEAAIIHLLEVDGQYFSIPSDPTKPFKPIALNSGDIIGRVVEVRRKFK